MKKDVFTFLVGGEAGHGVKKAGKTAAQLFTSMKRHIFEMDDYQSLIRGGHNFSVVSTSTRPITSHYMNVDLIVALDERSYELHKNEVVENGVIVYNSSEMDKREGIGVPFTDEAKKYSRPNLRLGVGAFAVLTAALNVDEEKLSGIIEAEYPDPENNRAYAETIYNEVHPAVGDTFALDEGDKQRPILTGNQAMGLGAGAAGLDTYFAYPMTPASPLLHYLAAHKDDLGIAVVHPENEIAVINMAIGAAFAGARAMVGTSGGGFALMEEAFSLAGMAEVPLLCVLSSRPGPSTGVPTYTEQGDLQFALHQGHGDFPRVVASPGSVEEAFHLTAQMLSIVWQFQIPGIILTEKHLAESAMTVDIDVGDVAWVEPQMHEGGKYTRYRDTETGVSPLLFPPSKELIKWNSYEHDELGITTESSERITQMHEKRCRKREALVDHMEDLHTVNVYGERGPTIFTYGSSTLSVLEALRKSDLEATIVQPIYLEPFPVWELEKYEKEGIIVEQSCAGQFASLLKERAEIMPTAVIRRYDGRPFNPPDLAKNLQEAM